MGLPNPRPEAAPGAEPDTRARLLSPSRTPRRPGLCSGCRASPSAPPLPPSPAPAATPPPLQWPPERVMSSAVDSGSHHLVCREDLVRSSRSIVRLFCYRPARTAQEPAGPLGHSRLFRPPLGGVPLRGSPGSLRAPPRPPAIPTPVLSLGESRLRAPENPYPPWSWDRVAQSPATSDPRASCSTKGPVSWRTHSLAARGKTEAQRGEVTPAAGGGAEVSGGPQVGPGPALTTPAPRGRWVLCRQPSLSLAYSFSTVPASGCVPGPGTPPLRTP